LFVFASCFWAQSERLFMMDDWSERDRVTNCLVKSSGYETSPEYFVTAAWFRLSLPLGWTGWALHG
jgi:hypothetical protein